MKKLKINITCGVIDIITTLLYFFAVFLVGNFTGAIGPSDGTEALQQFLLIVAIVCIVIHFVSFFQSHNFKMRLLGPIFGLLGHVIYLIFGVYLAWLSIIFTLLGAIFLFKDNHYTDEVILPKEMSK